MEVDCNERNAKSRSLADKKEVIVGYLACLFAVFLRPSLGGGKLLGRSWSGNEAITVMVVLLSVIVASVWIWFTRGETHRDVEKKTDQSPTTGGIKLSAIETLDIQKLHLEVNQMRYFELLSCSFGIVLVSAAAPSFSKSASLGLGVVVGVCGIAAWHSVIMNVRSRITTYLRYRNWSVWEKDYRKFANKHSELRGSQRSVVVRLFVGLVLSPLAVFVIDHAPSYLWDEVRPEKFSSWIEFWLLCVFSIMGAAYVVRLGGNSDPVLKELTKQWEAGLNPPSTSDNGGCEIIIVSDRHAAIAPHCTVPWIVAVTAEPSSASTSQVRL